MKTNRIFTLVLFLVFWSYVRVSANTWYDSAQIRIDSLRKGNFTLKIKDKDGNGAKDSVKIIHRKHEFPWGIAIDLTYNTGNVYTTSQTVTANSDAEIYSSERWLSFLAYVLPSIKGKKYKLTVKLSEIYFDVANSRLFDVYVNGQKIMQNIDKFALANGKNKAIDTTINVVATDSVIKLSFQATKDNASIMGIVLSDSVGNAFLRINCGGDAMTTKSGNYYVNDLAYIDKDAVQPGTSNDDWLKAVMLKYCNYGVCGNQFKWSGIESTHGQLNYAPFENTLNWFKKVGWDMRAHCLLWGGTSSTDYHELPQWVGVLEPTAMYDTCKMRVKREVTRYKGIVSEYDVLNEPSHATYLQSRVGDSINWNCFKWAYEADPNARLFVNDYNIIEWQDQTNNFVALVRKMLNNGAPITGIGAQCHIGSSTDIVNFKNRFDQLGQFGLPVKVTEFDMNAASISQQAQAIETAKMMRLCFSHPAIEGFIFWGLTNPGWATGVMNIINEDKTPRIVADSVFHLIHEEWTTNISDITNGTGSFNFKGYYGDYDILVKVGNTWKKYNVSYKKANQDSVFILKETEGKATNPLLKKVRINAPSNIELTFDKVMSDPSGGYVNFKVFDTLTNYVQSAVLKAGDSTTIILTTKSSFKAGHFIPVSYFPGNVTSSDGGKLESFGPILDETLSAAYISSKTSSNGRKILVAFNSKIADTSVKAADFVVLINNNVNNVSAVAVVSTKDTVYLTLSEQITSSSATVTLTYQPGSLYTENGLLVTSFEKKSVTNGVLVPKCVSALTNTDGTTIQLNFDQTIDESTIQTSNFTVTVNNKNIEVTGAVLSGTSKRNIILSLSTIVNNVDTVMVSYKAGNLSSIIGVPVSDFSSQVVNKSKTEIVSVYSNHIELCPNPFTNQFTISGANDYEFATISDIYGRKIVQLRLNREGISKINTSDLIRGMYLIILSNKKGQTVFKMLKK